MAVCVQAEGYGDFPTPLGIYGVPFPASPSEGSSDLQMMNIITTPGVCYQPPVEGQQSGQSTPYWQEPGDSAPNGGGSANGEWTSAQANQGGWSPGGAPSGSPSAESGGWVSGSTGPCGPPPSRGVGPQGGPSGAGNQPSRLKRRFCTSYPDVQLCRRGGTCAFAHSREEIRAPLLQMEEEQQAPAAMTDDFFMYKYKTLWCPIGVQHEWHTCVYAHNYQDARRPVSIGYGARLCPYWSKKDTGAEYSQRCPLGLRCPYAHGAKEQLYHPQYFKTVICRDLRGKACPRQGLCAFFHHRAERRTAPASDEIDYSQPLAEDAFNNEWVAEFLSPPFLPDSGKGNEDCILQADGNGGIMASYNGNQVPQSPYGMNAPFVFLLPMPMSPQGGSPMGSPMANQMGSPMGGQMNNGMAFGQMVFVPVGQEVVSS